jgi:hypothetical protein
VATASIFEWFQKPAAVRFAGSHDRTYISWINHDGEIQARYYDHDTSAWSDIVTVDDLTDVSASEAIDDHNPPQMFVLPTGQIQLRYAVHDVNEAFYQKIATGVESIAAWGDRTTIADASSGVVHNYPQVKRITNGNLVMFYRRGGYNDAKEYYKVSTDSGATWGSPTLLIDHGTNHGVYAFVTNNGNEIHIAWNDATSVRKNIYYMYSSDGGANWKKRDGTAITLPATEATADLVFNSGAEQAYGWDIRLDESNNPYIVFAHKVDPNHEFRYAKYDSGWVTYQVCRSGQLYDVGTAHFYSGGIVIDPNDVNTVYLAKQQAFLEIQKWTTADGGANWQVAELITNFSVSNNFRLQCVENYNASMRLVWCKGPYTGIASGNWDGYGDVSIRTEAQ